MGKLPFNHPNHQVRAYASAISAARARLSDGRTSVEGIQISRRDIAEYTARLREMGVKI